MARECKSVGASFHGHLGRADARPSRGDGMQLHVHGGGEWSRRPTDNTASHVPRPMSRVPAMRAPRVPCPMSRVPAMRAPRVPGPMSRVPRPASHVPCPASQPCARPASHVPCPTSRIPAMRAPRVPCPMSRVSPIRNGRRGSSPYQTAASMRWTATGA